jgi:two-component system sensor histidine kinase PilS (NtrC family)
MESLFYVQSHYGLKILLLKIPITVGAFFTVAFLSSLLSEKAHKTQKELFAMEEHIKRVEKMAAVGEMAAGLAHEIKNPLASIMGSIHLMTENQYDDPDREHLARIILREGDRLATLTSNFLLFAKPTTVSSQEIKIEKAVAEIIELFDKDPLIQNRIEIYQNCHSGASIHMNPDHFRHVMSNLLINAAEAIDGPGEITVQTQREQNNIACLSITDTGCGIAPRALKTIFNPFFTTKPNGTGLGLSIVHRILDSYHIRLDVNSQLDMGTTISLRYNPSAMPTRHNG